MQEPEKVRGPHDETLKLLEQQARDNRALLSLRVSAREFAKARVEEYTRDIDALTTLVNSLEKSITTLTEANLA